MQKRIVTMLLAAALLVSGVLSILSIHGLQGNARIINYTGVVRGATQRLIKQEMNGQHNDALIARLDGILNELATGQGDNGLLRLENDAFQELIAQMQDQWEEIKNEIRQVRQGTDQNFTGSVKRILSWPTARFLQRRSIQSSRWSGRNRDFLFWGRRLSS